MNEPRDERTTAKMGVGADPAAAAGPARALTLHLLRMLETRVDAAGMVLQSELQSFSSRLQLKLLAAGLLFIAVWGGIVLLAIALPERLRIPVLGVVVAAFVAVAIWAFLAAQRKASSQAVGSLRWFLDGIRLDFEVLSRSLANGGAAPQAQSNEANKERDDLAA